ncbi:MAG: GtrA family protein [Chitinophagaceae bacterium]|nr:GtrA family protein [Chitinophagaceae bacterium]
MNFEVFAYLATGAANTLLNIGLFLLIKLLFTNSVVALEAATIISFTITVFTGFWLQKNFAFINSGNEIKETRRQFGKYSLVALQGQVSAYLLTKSMIVFLKINASTAYVVTAVIILTLNYFLQKFFTFKKQGTIMY